MRDTQDPSRREPAELAEGTRLLERYTIIDRVGTGGMASIYRAMDDRLDRVVCVKLLRLVVEGEGSAAGGSVYQATYSHFLQEALALSKLQHPNTLRIYDFGYLDGSNGPFQISEYLDAGNLEGRVRRSGPLPNEEVEHILERITGAVTEAHEHRIIHRDIKPSNILFARIGDTLVPKLADFGIARTELKKAPGPGEDAPAQDEAVSTVALFSPRWAAPEQLCGAEEGPTTDVYALGLLTTFMLTGRAPFDDTDVRSTFNIRVRTDDLLRRRLRDRGVEGHVRSALMAAMAANPARRIASASEFFERVRAALNAPPVAVEAPTPPPVRASDARLHPGPMTRRDSITVELESVKNQNGRPEPAPPPERTVQLGAYRIRLVEVNEVLELTRENPTIGELKLRVTMMVVSNALRINVKGLNCFVAWADGEKSRRPTPAVVAQADGKLDLISAHREHVGKIAWSFGTPTHTGRLFIVDGQELVVPYSEAKHAVVLHLGDDREMVAMCRRA